MPVWLVLSLARLAHAQTAADASHDAAAYQEAIHRALAESELGNWTEAKIFFERAHALRPSARTLRGLGRSCYELRLYAEAIEDYSQALASPVQPLTDAMRAEVTRALQDAEHFVSRVRIETVPDSAIVEVDKHPAHRDAEGRVLLDPGPHELVVRAAGYAELEKKTEARGGEDFELRLTLEPAEATDGAPPTGLTPAPVAAPSPADDRAAHPIAPWIVVGASGAVAVTGAVLLAVALSERSSLQHPSDATWSAKDQAAYDRVPTLSAIGIVALSAGAAGVAAGLAWRFWPKRDASTARASLQPTCGGVQVTGTF